MEEVNISQITDLRVAVERIDNEGRMIKRIATPLTFIGFILTIIACILVMMLSNSYQVSKLVSGIYSLLEPLTPEYVTE
jgi:hypothetical protein